MKAKMYNWSCWVKETRADVLYARYEKLLQDSGFHIVDSCVKMFSPHGFTALFLLSESHFAIHTFPERGKSYLELSSCVQAQFEHFVKCHNYDATTCDE
jgi:S-adenosylmethionine/arginine decarboxylase-like enzyme